MLWCYVGAVLLWEVLLIFKLPCAWAVRVVVNVVTLNAVASGVVVECLCCDWCWYAGNIAVLLASQLTQRTIFLAIKNMTTCTKCLLNESKIGCWGELPFLTSNICQFRVRIWGGQIQYLIGSRRQLIKPLIFILILQTQTIIYNIELTIDTIFILSLYTTGSRRNFKKR